MTLLSVLILILIAGYLLERILEYLNARNWSENLPAELEGLYDAEAYKKAQLYDKANKRLSLLSDSLTMLIMLAMLLTGTFGQLDNWAVAVTGSPVQATLLFFGVIAAVSEIIGIPFSIYKTFVIETKFGFNKTTPALFIMDKIKSYLLAIVLLGGLITVFSVFYNTFQEHFW